MLTRSWYHGLYPRIALSFVALITFVLGAQAVGYVFLFQRANEVSSSDVEERGRAWTKAIAADLANGLTQEPTLDVARRLAQLDVTTRVFVIFKDGRVIGPAPANVTAAVLQDFERIRNDGFAPNSWVNGPYRAALLKVHDQIVAVVAIGPRATIDRFGSLIIAAGLTLLVVAIFTFSIAVVGPVRSRLRDLQAAAKRLGTGDLEARVPVYGSDEVSDVAQAFNSMACELRRRTIALETSDRLRRQLVADVSHELMTPLTAVLGNLETLDMDEVDLDRVQRKRRVAIATREAMRLRRVIGDLLNTARYEAGGVAFEFEEIATAELFQQVRLRHETECRLRRISFDTSITPDAETFDADPFRIEQAIENVVANGLRYTPEGGRIALSAGVNQSNIIIEVYNAGPGIAPEHLSHIFDRFYKAGSTRGIASPGSGLGLSIVKAIIMGHGGHVGATSADGVGTIIRLEFPAINTAVEHPVEA